MPQLRAVLNKGFTLLQVVITLVVIAVLATLVLAKMGGVKEEAHIAAMKNDLRNYATAEEQYFHATSDGYGSLAQVDAKQGFAFTEDVSPDTSSHSRRHWYLRVQHANTDVKCELFFSPAQEVSDAPNRIICPGDPNLMPVSVDLATNGIQFTLNTNDATYSAKVRQADGAVLDFEVHVRHPNDSTSLLCRQSGPREVLCSGDIPVDQEGEYIVTASGAIGGASPSETGELSARDSVIYEVTNRPPSASFSFSPAEPQTDDLVTFDASESTDIDGSVVSYSWDFGDGGTATGPTPSHSYGQDGEYSVRLTVTDNLGKQDTTAQAVPVSNRAPSAAFTFSPTEPETDETIRLDGSTSEDPDGTISGYRWSFDGVTATAWGTFTTETSFGSDGDHVLALQVRDDDGTMSNWVEDTVTVTNQAPTASFTFSPSSPQTDETINLDGSNSSDADGGVVGYRWRFDGGTASAWSTSATASTSFSADGDHTLELQVRDDDGYESSWASQTVTVQNQVPAVSSLSCDDPKLTGQTITCTAQGSDPDGSITNWEWGDHYDGHRDTNTSTESQASRSFADDGTTYTASVVATDDDGATASASVSVSVNNREPTTSSLSCNDPKETGQTVTCTAEASDPDGTIANYNWGNAFNGTKTSGSATPSEAARSFADDGTYTAAVQAKDDDSVWGPWETVEVTVTNQAPTASFTFSPSSPQTDETISLDGSNSSDADGSVVDYRWRFDGGTAGTWSSSATTSTSFSSDGDHTLELQVRDDDGDVSSWETQTVTVQNQPPSADFSYSPTSPTAGEGVTFDGDPSFDPDGSLQRWSWDFGDGTSASGELVNHTFDTSGSHNVRLTVVDDDNDSTAVTKAVTVEEVVYACEFNSTVISQPGNTNLTGSSWWANGMDGEYDGEDLRIGASAFESCETDDFGNSFCGNWSPTVEGFSGAHSWSKDEATGSSCGSGGSSGSGTGDPSDRLASTSSNGSCEGNTLTVDVPNPPADKTDWSFSYTIQMDGGAYEAEHTVSCSRQ